MNRVFEKGTLQAAVVEFALDNGRQRDGKEAQLFTYVRSDTHSLPSDRSPMNLGVSFLNLNCRSPMFKVFGYYQINGDVFGIVPLTGGLQVDVQSLTKLFYAVAAFGMVMDVTKLPSARSAKQDLPYPSGTGGVCKIGNRRVKVYNYLSFEGDKTRFTIPHEEQRSPVPSEKMLPNAKVVTLAPDLTMLLYDDVIGGHNPFHTDCVAACIEHLLTAHQCEKIVHCDLHLGNFVFNSDDPSLSRIIDWDHSISYSGIGSRRYVSGWQPLVERHPEAMPLAPVKLEHEWHSLCATLRRFRPQKQDLVSQWTTLVNESMAKIVNDPSTLLNSLTLLRQSVKLMNTKLVVSEATIVVTGSPPRDSGTSDKLLPISEVSPAAVSKKKMKRGKR